MDNTYTCFNAPDFPRRRNVVVQVAEELKTVRYATPPMEERRKKRKKMLLFPNARDITTLVYMCPALIKGLTQCQLGHSQSLIPTASAIPDL